MEARGRGMVARLKMEGKKRTGEKEKKYRNNKIKWSIGFSTLTKSTKQNKYLKFDEMMHTHSKLI